MEKQFRCCAWWQLQPPGVQNGVAQALHFAQAYRLLASIMYSKGPHCLAWYCTWHLSPACAVDRTVLPPRVGVVADVGVTYNSSATYEHVVSHGPDVRHSSPSLWHQAVMRCPASHQHDILHDCIRHEGFEGLLHGLHEPAFR